MYVYEIETSCGTMHLFSNSDLDEIELQELLSEQQEDCEWEGQNPGYPKEFVPGAGSNPDPAPSQRDVWLFGSAPAVS